MEEIKQLDAILTFIATNAVMDRSKTKDELFKYLSRASIPIENIDVILNKLERDKYVDVEINSNLTKRYFISFEGKLFERSGGYDADIKARDAESKRIRELETYPKALNDLTFWVALGTVGLLVIEVVKFLVDHKEWFYCRHQ